MNTKKSLLLMLAILLLTACGQSGSLYLPEKQPKVIEELPVAEEISEAEAPPQAKESLTAGEPLAIEQPPEADQAPVGEP